jgi:D-alanyl-D-alanine carboxypeptidase/D-alanyl-D-alanine-endopeptidase (penicillin-binding protein 4)
MKSLPPTSVLASIFRDYRSRPERIASILAITISCLGAESPTGHPAALQDKLQRELSGTTASPVLWGALVMRTDGTRVFGTNTHHSFIPASNTKLFIGAMALDQLGPKAQLRTPAHVSNRPDSEGVLRSDLWILGQGDPSLGTAPRSGTGNSAGTWDEALVPWVTQWQSKGLRRVIGDLVLCDAAVQIPEYGPGWDDEDRAEWYGAPVSAFVVNDNTFRLMVPTAPPGATSIPYQTHPPLPSLAVDWRVLPGTNTSHRIQYERRLAGGPIEFHGRFATGTNGWSAELAVANPAQVFGELLKRTLERRGIPVSGSVRVVHATNGCPAMEWDHWTSEPLAQRLAFCLKPSQNLHAQLLLAEVGRQAERQTTSGSAASSHRRHDEWGLARLPEFLTRAGIANDSVRIEEGSGLSRTNRVTPAATAALLRFMIVHPQQKAWRDSLPLGGVDGTLRHRFKTGPAHRNVRAKTGSLRGVHALGGYVTTASGEELIFAIYANQAQGDPQVRARMDRFVEILANSQNLSPPSPTSATTPR